MIVVQTNRELVSSKQELKSTKIRYAEARRKLDALQEKEHKYKTYFRRGCDYLYFERFKEALTCFKAIEFVRVNDIPVTEKMIVCFEGLGDEVHKDMYETRLERLRAVP